MESTYPSAPGDTLVFENNRVRVWSMRLEPGGMFDFSTTTTTWSCGRTAGRPWRRTSATPTGEISLAAEPGFVLFQTVGTAEPLTPHRIRNVGDTAVTHYISERSPSETRLPGETNGRGTFVDGNSGGQK